MKIAEALMQRKDLVSTLSRLKEDILSDLITTENRAPTKEYLTLKIETYLKTAEQLGELNSKIDIVNSKVLLDKLEEMRILNLKLSFFKELRTKLIESNDWRFSSADNPIIKNLSCDEITLNIVDIEKQKRNIDRLVQKINWATELE